MEMSFLRLVFYGIPENIAVVALAFSFAKVKFDWGKFFLMGIFLAFTAFLLRLIPITFGVHTIVCLGLLIFLLNYFVKVDLTRSITSVLFSFIIMAIVETGSRILTLKILQWSIEEVMKNELLIIVTGIPEVAILFLLAFFIKMKFV
ncbi:MAG: hypothetical protein ACOX4H_06330 [Bacillota bacterium]|jgi:hypothetical protein|nr:hypothetical protein [Clostridia bacterium]